LSHSGTVETQHSTAAGKLPAWRAAGTLAERELVRFFRQRTRVIGALGQPLIFWILFGAGLHGSFRAPDWAESRLPDMSYQEYFFPGVAVLIVMFTAIFSTISIIEDRREGFLQGVLVAPVPRWSLVVGKLLGGTVLAVLQATLFLIVGPLLVLLGLSPDMNLQPPVAHLPQLLGFLSLIAFGLTGLGYVIAWPMNSTQGFHAIMSVFLMPMWLLSGAFFPGQSGWLSWIIRLNPLTYGVAGLRRLLYPAETFASNQNLPSLAICWSVMLIFSIICLVLAVVLTGRRTSHDAR